MANKPLAYSRWRRLPAGVHRITEHRLPDYRSEPQRLSLFLPGWVLDEAERLAFQEGYSSVQEYCETLLQAAVEAKTQRPGAVKGEPKFTGTLDLDEIANSLQAVAGWPAFQGLSQNTLEEGLGPGATGPASALGESGTGGASGNRAREPGTTETSSETGPRNLSRRGETEGDTEMAEGALSGPKEAVEVVLRHAGFSEEAGTGLLPSLRRGEPVAPSQAEELLRALVALEQGLRGQERIGRTLAYALYRLAFEGQVLLTDAWPALASDQATLDVLRMVQESVERVLSGEDVRYYVPEAPGEESGS